METLTPAQRSALRAKAHHLHPVVFVGHHGLTPAVLHEIDVALLAHELIKVRVFSDARDERSALLERICAEMGAAPVQHLGKVLTLWRPAPEPEPKSEPRSKGTSRTATHASTTAAARTPGAGKRRGRNESARAASAPRGGAAKPKGHAPASRRRRSDVTTTTTPGKRRKTKSGAAPTDRQRAPATSKGPFEPGKRTAKPAIGVTRRRRRQP